ncbi:MAG: DUF5362 family protein [Treponema sp.]|jgi:hypothetical protein|nr:DUF5362 family protein [Treponema sp.]
MSDGSNNPYESPQAEADAVNPLSTKFITEEMLYYLKRASPWLRFAGIVRFILAGFIILMLLAMIFGFQSLISAIPGFGTGLEAAGPALLFGYIVNMLVTATLIFFPALFMFRFGKKIQSYLYTNDTRDLEQAFKENKSYWTFTGVLTIIGLGFFGLFLIIMIIAAAFGAFVG